MDPQDVARGLFSQYLGTGDIETLERAVAGFRAAAADSGDASVLSDLSLALHTLYERTGERMALEEAVAVGRSVVATSGDPSGQVAALNNLSGFLKSFFRLTGDPALLDEASAVLRRGIAMAADDRVRALLLSNLADALELQYFHTGSVDALQESAQLLRQGLMLRMQAGPVPTEDLARLGNLLRVCYERTGDSEALDDAIAITHQAASAAPAGLARADMLSRLGIVLRLSYERTGEAAVFREAVDAGREAVTAVPSNHLLHAAACSRLGDTLRSGYERTGDDSLLSEALGVHRQALAALTENHPERALILAAADKAFETGYQRTGQMALLDAWIRERRECASVLPDHGANRSGELFSIAGIQRMRFQATGEIDALDAVIEALREAWGAAPADFPARQVIASNLGTTLQVRYRRRPDGDTIAEAVRMLRQAAAATPETDPGHSSTLTYLAQALQSMYEATGDQALLEEAIAAGRAAISSAHPDQQARETLAGSLQARYERTGDHSDLRQAMELFRTVPAASGDGEAAPDLRSREAAALPSQSWLQGPGRRARAWMDMYLDRRDLNALDRTVEVWDRFLIHPWFATLTPDIRASALAGSGVAHLYRYDERSDNADLDVAVRCCADSVEFTDHADYRSHLSNLSMALRAKYERDGDMDSLRRAADIARKSAEMTPELSQERAGVLTNLGGILRRMREATGDPAYLDAAVEALELAAQIPVSDDSSRAACLNNASVGLHDRYDARGDETDLQRSIEYSRRALETAPADHRDRPGYLSNLGNTLRHRYERTGVLADLDDAIEVLERAAATAPQQWMDRRRCLMNLSTALRERARVNRSPEFLRRALRASSEAVQLTPTTSPEYDLYAGSLAITWGYLADATGEPEHIDEQISLYEELLRMPGTSVRRPWLQADLATALLGRATARKEQAGLDSAVELARECLGRAMPGTTGFAHCAGTLAGMLALRASQDPDAAAEADTNFRRACITALSTQPEHALATALRWARWREDEEDWPTAVEAYHLAAEAADRLFATQIGREDKEARLRSANGMPAQAALALVRVGQQEAAALMLERGRVRLLAEALGRNSAALDRLADVGQEALAERFRAAQRRLGALDASKESATYGDEQADRMRGDDLASALAEHGAALAAIRQVPRYERFLLPAEPSDLAAAADRPLIYLAAARRGGVALIVTRASGARDTMPSVEPVELPELTGEAVWRWAIMLRDAGQARDRDPGLWLGTLDAVCRWLWIAAMGRLLDKLTGLPAACLVPAGLLASLPLHAAWTDDDERPTGRRYALDHVALSYAPSAVTLLHARELARRQPLAALLGVAEPQPVSASALPLAAAEVEAAAALLGVPCRELRGRAAGRVRILTELPGHSVAHFACHGYARPDAPLDSALLTSDNEPLTLRDIFGLELAGRDRSAIRLAVLSACETQLPGTELPDELVSLPGGFLQAGAAAVVASQWTIGDTAAALVTTMFYRNLASGADGATALRDAQVWLRDTTNGEKAAFMHPRTGQCGLPETAARPLWRRLVRASPAERSFAMPSHWAAMTYTGA